MKLPQDIVDYISHNFAEDEVSDVVTALQNAKLHDGREPDFRLLRCALVGSSNFLEKVERLVSDLTIDYRDVIVAGEYASEEGELVQVRDLSVPLESEEQ